MSPQRIGNFTSSEIGKLMSNGRSAGSIGAPFYTYIDETNMERRLGLPLDREIDARATSWGSLCEKRVFKLLDIEYRPLFSETFRHPAIDYWLGTPDVFKNYNTVSDIKAPITRKSFCQLVDPYYEKEKLIHEGLTIEAARNNHQKGDEYFYQILSNGIITGRNIGELIVYMPYKDELDEIRKMADGDSKFYWIQFATDEELPYLVRGGHYKNLNVISFDILQRDKDALTERVLKAGESLIPWP